MIGDGALVILRGANTNTDQSPEDMISVRMWIDAHRIISVQLRPLRSVNILAEQIAAGKGPREAGSFIAALVERLNSFIGPVVAEMDETVDELEVRL